MTWLLIGDWLLVELEWPICANGAMLAVVPCVLKLLFEASTSLTPNAHELKSDVVTYRFARERRAIAHLVSPHSSAELRHEAATDVVPGSSNRSREVEQVYHYELRLDL